MTAHKLLLTGLFSILLAACGGGGGGGTDAATLLLQQRASESAAITLNCSGADSIFYSSYDGGYTQTADGKVDLGRLTFAPLATTDAPVKVCSTANLTISDIDASAAKLIKTTSTQGLRILSVSAGGAFSSLKQKTVSLFSGSYIGFTEAAVRNIEEKSRLIALIKDANGNWVRVPLSTTRTYVTNSDNSITVTFSAPIDSVGYYLIDDL